MSNKDNRITFRAGEQLLEMLAEYHSGTQSNYINQNLMLFDHVMCASIPDLSSGEWMAIFDSLNGVWLQNLGDFVNADSLSYRVADFHMYSERLDKKWKIDSEALMNKLSSLEPAQSCAVYYIIEKFWKTNVFKSMNSYDEAKQVIESLRNRFKPESLNL